MSEYQYYEFLAVDRPLDERQQAEVRALSTRARITATSFVNEYDWGDFRGDPNRMVELYYDEKDRLLRKVVTDHAAAVRVEMLRRYRDQHVAPIPA